VIASQALMHAIQAVTHQIGGKTGLGKPLLEIVTGLRFVFDDENFHGGILPEAPGLCPQITNL